MGYVVGFRPVHSSLNEHPRNSARHRLRGTLTIIAIVVISLSDDQFTPDIASVTEAVRKLVAPSVTSRGGGCVFLQVDGEQGLAY